MLITRDTVTIEANVLEDKINNIISGGKVDFATLESLADRVVFLISDLQLTYQNYEIDKEDPLYHQIIGLDKIVRGMMNIAKVDNIKYKIDKLDNDIKEEQKIRKLRTEDYKKQAKNLIKETKNNPDPSLRIKLKAIILNIQKLH